MENDVTDQLEKFLDSNNCLIYGEMLSYEGFIRVMKLKPKREEFLQIIEQIPLTEE